MAERRMFAKTIIDSDAFLDMPLSAQALYFHLSMRADDEGFVNNPKKIQRMVGASDDDCKLLVVKRFILTFESGVIVIKHWKIHNYIRNDRFKETVYVKEKSMLALNENNAYTKTDTIGIPSGRQAVDKMDTQDSIGKDSIGEVREKEKSTYVLKKKSTDGRSDGRVDDSQAEFFERYPQLQIDSYSGYAISEMDFDTLLKRFEESAFLRTRQSFSWVCQKYRQIVAGKYADYGSKKDDGMGYNGTAFLDRIAAGLKAKEDMKDDSVLLNGND